MKKGDVTPGEYLYIRPHWTHGILVSVVEQDKEMLVRYEDGYYPSALRNIPSDAEFTPCKITRRGEW